MTTQEFSVKPPDGAFPPVRVGISRCLLGEPVRWDGGGKLNPAIIGALGPFCSWVGVCPEVEAGLGAPREPARLQAQGGDVRLVGVESGRDWTDAALQAAAARLDEVQRLDICGYILKKNSPSCGIDGVPVFTGAAPDAPPHPGQGVFAAALMRRFPLLPVAAEDELQQAAARARFLWRIRACQRALALEQPGAGVAALRQLHGAYRLLLQACSPWHYQSLRRLAGQAEQQFSADLLRHYRRLLLDALRQYPAIERHAEILSRLYAQVRQRLAAAEAREIAAAITDYQQRRAPLSRPLSILWRHAALNEQEPLAGQAYFIDLLASGSGGENPA